MKSFVIRSIKLFEDIHYNVRDWILNVLIVCNSNRSTVTLPVAHVTTLIQAELGSS
jgi:hypothetical protein